MNDVFDEDLMRELGLDPDEIEAVKSKAPEPKKDLPKEAPASEAAKSTIAPPAKVALPVKPSPKTITPDEPEDLRHYGHQLSGEVPVHLAAVIGKKTITLRDVMELKMGEVLDFKKQPQDPIDLVANGKLVAKAELVMIDGRVGARIIKLIK